jgi:hypothetical protein
MGIADYGIGPAGAYQYSTNSSRGTIYIGSLSTRNASNSGEMTFQLNVVLQFSNNNKLYVYWIQDVLFIDTATNAIFYENNIWNMSSPSAIMRAGAVSGSGDIYPAGSLTFYAVIASPSLPGSFVTLSYPTTIKLQVDTSLDSSNRPQVKFAYDDGYGMIVYDTVTFNTAASSTKLDGFVVNGFNYNPAGLFYDSELVLGGPGSSLTTSLIQSDVRLQLEYWNGHNYQMVTNAYNFGSNTAETIGNVLDETYYYPDNGSFIAQLMAGSGLLGKLYDQSQLGMITIRSPLASGILYVRNASATLAVAAQYPFVDGVVTIPIIPGYYDLQLYQGNTLFSQGRFTVNGGQFLNLQTPLSSISMTLSYSVQGGGSGYTAPTITYTYNGNGQAATLTPSPSTITMDGGTSWSVSSSLPGSSATERWATKQPTTGNATSSQTLNFVYYYQFSVSLNYNVVGGGAGFSPALVSGRQFGTTTLISAGTSAWIDAGSSYSYASQLSGSSSSERWFATGASGTVTSPVALTTTYYHQYYISASYIVAGGGTPSAPTFSYSTLGASTSLVLGTVPQSFWADSDDYTSTNPLAGSTAAERWYSSGAGGTVQSSGNLIVRYVHQFYLSINGGSSSSQWYDTGITPTLKAQVVYGRTSGTGFRLTSYSIDGAAPVQLAGTLGTVDIKVTMDMPHSLTFNSIMQYEVTLDSGATSSLNSITAPTLSGDENWYDSGSAVTVTLNGVWGRASGTGNRLVSYSINEGSPSSVATSEPVTVLSLGSIGSPQTINTETTVQFELTTPTGTLNSVTATPIRGDGGWYDSGTTVEAVYDYSGDVKTNQSRLNAVSYSIDEGEKSVLTRAGSGTFTVRVTMGQAHTVDVISVVQYFASLEFSDASGAHPITPNRVEINLNDQVMKLASFGIWLDNGARLSFRGIIWENTDIKPLDQKVYKITGPASITIQSRIYDARLRVTDVLGFPISGAAASIILANGTQLSRTTSSEGTIVVEMVPLGKVHAVISNLGTITEVLGDASMQPEITGRVPLSYPVIGVAIALIAVPISAISIRRLRHRG